MRVAITGGAGFIGRATVLALKRQGNDPIPIDKSHGHDVMDRKIAGVLRGCDAVIHLAGVLGTGELFDNPDEAIDVNIKGTLRVLEACRDHGLIYVGITVPDCWPSIYQMTKLAAKRLASTFHQVHGVPMAHVRAFNAYGIGQPYGPGHPQKIVPTFASRSWRREPMPIWGDGQQQVDLVHVDHVAKCLASAVSLHLTRLCDRTFDAGTGETMSVIDVARRIGDITGSSLVEFHPMRRGELPHADERAITPGAGRFDEFSEPRFRAVVESYR